MSIVLFSAVHSDMWRRSSGQDSPVSDPREALSWLFSPSQTCHVPGLQHQLLPTAREERYSVFDIINTWMLLCEKVMHPIICILYSELTSLFLFFLQMLPVGITSTGVTWFHSMVSATTSSMASSAASPVQIQTYNHERASVWDTERPDWSLKQQCFCYEGMVSIYNSKDISMEVQKKELQCPFFSLRCRTSGYKNLMFTALHKNVIRTVQIQERLMRRNGQIGILD